MSIKKERMGLKMKKLNVKREIDTESKVDLSMQRMRIKYQAYQVESLHRILKLYAESFRYKANEDTLYDCCNLIEKFEEPIGKLKEELDILELMLLGRC